MAKVQLQLFEKRERKIAGWVVHACGGVRDFVRWGAFQSNAGSKPLGDSFDFNLFTRL